MSSGETGGGEPKIEEEMGRTSRATQGFPAMLVVISCIGQWATTLFDERLLRASANVVALVALECLMRAGVPCPPVEALGPTGGPS